MGEILDLTLPEHDWLRDFVDRVIQSVQNDEEFPVLRWPQDYQTVDPGTIIFKLCQLYLYERKRK